MYTFHGFIDGDYYNALSVDPNGRLKLTYDQRRELKRAVIAEWHAYANELFAPFDVWLVGLEINGPVDNDLWPDFKTWKQTLDALYSFEPSDELVDRALKYDEENRAKGDAWDE